MTEREWREASDLRRSLLGIALVLSAGAVLRFWGARHAALAPVEGEIIDPVVQLLHTGSYRPHALTHPTLPVYLHAAVAVVHFLWGAILGRWASIGDFNALQIIAWGRACSALLGTAALAVVYRIGARWGARHALLAAGLMAVMPPHVAVSREISGGAPFTLFAALTLLLSLEACEQKSRARFAAAGAAAGLAAGSHYAGALTILLPLVAAWMTRTDDSSRAARAALAFLAAIAAFVIVTPLTAGDLPAFLNGFAIAAAPARVGTADMVDPFQELLSALQWPGLILAFSGLSLAVVRAITGPGHTRWTLLAAFPLVYFALLAWHGATSSAIVLPMLPAATVLAAIAVISGVSQLRRFDIPRAARTALIAALTIAAVLPPAVLSVALVRDAGRGSADRRVQIDDVGPAAQLRHPARHGGLTPLQRERPDDLRAGRLERHVRSIARENVRVLPVVTLEIGVAERRDREAFLFVGADSQVLAQRVAQMGLVDPRPGERLGEHGVGGEAGPDSRELAIDGVT
jgi:hypothetical protein